MTARNRRPRQRALTMWLRGQLNELEPNEFSVREVKQMFTFEGKFGKIIGSGSPRIADVATVLEAHRQVLNQSLIRSE